MGLGYTLFVKPVLVLAAAVAVVAGIWLLPEYWPDHQVASDAMLAGDTVAFRRYLERGLDPDERARWRTGTRRVLWRTARAPFRANDYGSAPEPLLAVAIARCELRFAHILVEAGANVNARTRYGRSVLAEAALCDDPAIVRAMLARGADAKAAEPNGETVLWEKGLQGWRLRPSNHDVIRLLEAAGARSPGS